MAGDGTTSVVVICGSLLKKAQELLDKGVHPTVISDSFNKAAQKACEVRQRCADHPAILMSPAKADCHVADCHATSSMQILEGVAIPVDLEDREQLIKAATT